MNSWFQSAISLIEKGTSFDSLGKVAEAVKCYDQAESIIKGSNAGVDRTTAKLMLAYNRAVAYDRLGNHEAALAHWASSLAAFEELPEGYRECGVDKMDILLGKALTLANAGLLGEAINIGRKAFDMRPDAWLPCSRMAYFSLLAEDWSGAVDFARRALAVNAKDVHSIANLGAGLMGMSRTAEAERTLLQAVALVPSHAPALYSLGTLYLFAGKLADAEAALRKALAARPGYTEAWNHLGLALLEQKKTGFLECFEKAVKANARNLSACTNLANAIMRERSCTPHEAAEEVMRLVRSTQGR